MGARGKSLFFFMEIHTLVQVEKGMRKVTFSQIFEVLFHIEEGSFRS